MNTQHKTRMPERNLVAAAVAAVLLAACASTPTLPPGAADVRSRLTALQADPQLGERATVAVKEAEAAVRLAETAQPDKALAAHRVRIADRKVETARELAAADSAEAERAKLSQQRDSARLAARTREADVARMQARVAEDASAAQKVVADEARNAAGVAQAAAAGQQQAAAQARSEAELAQQSAEESKQQAAVLQRQLDDMHAQVTDRGVVLTLGDVLFTSGKANLASAASGNLNKLAAFLARYPDRTIAVEGYTDDVGAADFNQTLSERRAESVKSYLAGEGVSIDRIATVGRGEDDPVAANDSATGRQQNRRVQIIISDPPSSRAGAAR